MKIEKTRLPGVQVVRMPRYDDPRGFFTEVFRSQLFEEHGLPARFVQLNHSGSVKDVVRGLHFQFDPPMAKLMRVTRGAAFLVAADIRPGSPTLGEWVGREATADNRLQLFAPPGFARGFAVLSDYVEIHYMCTSEYNPRGEGGIRWSDPDVGIAWPVERPILSERDETAPTLAQWLATEDAGRFAYTAPPETVS